MHFTSLLPVAVLAGSVLAVPAPKEVRDSSAVDAVIPPVVEANPRANDEDLIAKLLTASTSDDRLALLTEPGDFIFDFNPAKAPTGSVTVGAAGDTVAATGKTFPAVIGNGVSMTVGFVGPCGLNTPHIHNRATEFNIVVQGRLVTNFFTENGAELRNSTLSQYQATVIPQASIHLEYNPDCTPAVFVAGFNNIDPGVSTIGTNFFSLDPNAIGATLGGYGSIDGQNFAEFKDKLPSTIANGISQCLSACGLTRSTNWSPS